MADEKLDPKELGKELTKAVEEAQKKPAKADEKKPPEKVEKKAEVAKDEVIEKVIEKAKKDFVIAYNPAMDISMVGECLKVDGLTVHCENPAVWRGNLITKRDSAANTKLYLLQGSGILRADIIVQIDAEAAKALGADV